MSIPAHAFGGKYHNIIGKFTPMHPLKYKGRYPLIFKSKLEARMMLWLDNNQNVKSWIYEPASIKYIDRSDHNRQKNYYIDFLVEMTIGGVVKRLMIETKCNGETVPPKNPHNSLKLLESTKTYVKNLSKWTAAKKYAKQFGYEFMIVTEDFFKNK